MTQKRGCLWGRWEESRLTLWVEQAGDPQLSLCHAEGLLQVLLAALPVHLAHVYQMGPGEGERQRVQRVQIIIIMLSTNRTQTTEFSANIYLTYFTTVRRWTTFYCFYFPKHHLQFTLVTQKVRAGGRYWLTFFTMNSLNSYRAGCNIVRTII